MAFSEIIVEEGDVTADAQAVGGDAGLDGMAEATVDILLAGVGIGSLKRVSRGASGTLSKPQKSRSSAHKRSSEIRRASVGMPDSFRTMKARMKLSR